MARRPRPNLPGGTFHLTARTLDRKRLFTPTLRGVALDVVARAVPQSGARLLAVAMMPNHLHLVVQQGRWPLATLMQPILRRLAHLLQCAHGLEGPIFWRPYACRPCLDPGHARNAIVYTHLNPVRAGLCGDPQAYGWTSHRLYGDAIGPGGPVAYTTVERLALVIDPRVALPLFATGYGRSLEQLREDYQTFIAWRLSADRLATSAMPYPTTSARLANGPVLPWGDLYWCSLSPLFHSPAAGGGGRAWAERPSPRPDMTDVARRVLSAEAPGLPLDVVRGRCGGARYSQIRRRLIMAIHRAGFRNVQIAGFLGVSQSAVSKVVMAAARERPAWPDGTAGFRTG
jgi:REP element-mobilizing transposase RayT